MPQGCGLRCHFPGQWQWQWQWQLQLETARYRARAHSQVSRGSQAQADCSQSHCEIKPANLKSGPLAAWLGDQPEPDSMRYHDGSQPASEPDDLAARSTLLRLQVLVTVRRLPVARAREARRDHGMLRLHPGRGAGGAPRTNARGAMERLKALWY
eukprot:3934084-Rhodomonas_salina.6